NLGATGRARRSWWPGQVMDAKAISKRQALRGQCLRLLRLGKIPFGLGAELRQLEGVEACITGPRSGRAGYKRRVVRVCKVVVIELDVQPDPWRAAPCGRWVVHRRIEECGDDLGQRCHVGGLAR